MCQEGRKVSRVVERYLEFAKTDRKEGVDDLMYNLRPTISLRETKMIDFCLGLMSSDEAIHQVKIYLFNGTQMQRNYSVLFLARKNIWKPINKAYSEGLIDYRQAYSR